MKRGTDITGLKFNKLTVIGVSSSNIRNKKSWDCLCDCGNKKTAVTSEIVNGKVKSCGCLITDKQLGDIAGKKFNRLTAKYKDENNSRNWVFECSCGNVKSINAHSVVNSKTKSCGCLKVETTGNNSRSHGLSKTRLYTLWAAMVSRCTNPNNVGYETYKDLGICDDFLNFDLFYEHIGDFPDNIEKYSIDRIDNRLGYIKGNVRWATNKTQARNKSISSVNKTGTVGVWFSNRHGYLTCVGSYSDNNGSKITKEFGVTKYGIDLAFEMACEFIRQGILGLDGTVGEYGSELKDNILNGGLN